MALAAGSRLGPYEIGAPLGAGGMGEVYKARDTRLDRTVAIKVLPSAVADDPHFRERFDREARVIAALNHPHICTLHDIGRQDGVDFLVMEYVEGQTLAERLQKGALPLDQVLQHAIQIADALDKAHGRGIVHRDLKPANVMLTKSGVKLLDFGLAKSRPAGAVVGMSAAATMTGPLTAQGTILGTLHYMSPEQVEGKDADARSDLFAFGALVYEMATGKRAFEGQSAASVMAAILEREPPAMSSLQPIAPPLLDHLVSRCLVKDSDRRWQSAMDVVHELRWIQETGSGSSRTVAAQARRRPWIWVAATAVSSFAAVAVFAIHLNEVHPSQLVLRYSIALPKEGQSDGLYLNFHISPNGRFVAASAVLEQSLGIFVRELDSQKFRLLAGTDNSDFFWSPDSGSVGFFHDNGRRLKKVRVSGGPAEEICDIGPGGYLYDSHGSWSRDGVIVFATPRGGPLLGVPATGGVPHPVTVPGAGASHTSPAFLPDGRHFLYTSRGGASPGIYVASLDNAAGRRLLADQSSVQFAPPAAWSQYAHLIFTRESRLMAQRFDPKALELSGDAFALAEQALLDDSGAVAVSVSENGVLGYSSGRNREFDSRLTWFDRSGKALAAEGPSGPPAPAALSPDERTIAVLRRPAGPRIGDLWLRDLSRGFETRLTSENAVSGMANVVWSPDGSQIAFSSTASGSLDLYRKDVRATGPGEVILRNSNDKVLTDWSRAALLYTEVGSQSGADLWYMPLDGSGQAVGKPVPFAQTKFDETLGQISPDGRWIAYVSNESGDYEVYVRPFPSGAGVWRISKSVGRHVGSTTTQPRWGPDGKELFYLTGPLGKFTMMAVSPKLGPRPTPGSSPVFDFDSPKPLFQVRANAYAPWASLFYYSVSKDGQRFLIDHVDSATEPVLNMIVNWEQAFSGK